MYGESKKEFFRRLRRECNIYPNDVSEIIERLSDGDSTENICDEYRLDEVDLERIINQVEFNEPDEESVIRDNT